MGITKGILDAAIEAAEGVDAARISEIHVRVGEFTDIVEDALQFAFEALSPGTLAEGAKLTVTLVPASSRCRECSASYTHGRFDVLCPHCGSFATEIISGKELHIDGIVVDTPDDPGEE